MSKYYPGAKLWIRLGESLLAKLEWWHVVRYGKPRKGEYYISGAIVEAYRAPNDLDTEYWIVARGI